MTASRMSATSPFENGGLVMCPLASVSASPETIVWAVIHLM
jgi:hypothetical protein